MYHALTFSSFPRKKINRPLALAWLVVRSVRCLPGRSDGRRSVTPAQRAPAKAGASGAAGRRPALANLDVDMNVNPHGDRTTRASDPNVLGAENVADASADAAEDGKEALEAGLSSL